MLNLDQYSCLGAALRDALDRWPNEICLIEADRDREKTRLTYSDFKDVALPLARALEDADISALKADGWAAPEVFVAKGRDGKTDIWGIICRPKDFDPDKKYPVIEQIYAGPQGSFVPKTFSRRCVPTQCSSP